MESERTIWTYVAGACLLMIGYALCVLASAAIVRSRQSQLKNLKVAPFGSVRLAERILVRADRYLITVQISKFFSGLFIGVVLVVSLSTKEVQSLVSALNPGGEHLLHTVLFVAVVVLICLIVLTVVQVAKAVAFWAPEKSLCLLAIPLYLAGLFFSPLSYFVADLVGKILSWIGLSVPVEREVAVSAEEISEIIERSAEAGEIEEDEGDMIQGVFEFSETLVHEVMTPRADIITIREDQSLQEVAQEFVSEGYSRLLVIGHELDDVSGVLLAKDLIPYVAQGKKAFRVSDVMRDVNLVSESHPVDDLLQDFRRTATHFAVVLDEHGGVSGIVTLEDLIEEIVGEIFDEHDSGEDEEEVQQTVSGELLVDGSMSIDDLNDMYGFQFSEGEYDTVAGFVIHLLGRIPEVGDHVQVEHAKITVEALEQNRVTLLRISSLGDTQFDSATTPSQAGQRKADKDPPEQNQKDCDNNSNPNKVSEVA